MIRWWHLSYFTLNISCLLDFCCTVKRSTDLWEHCQGESASLNGVRKWRNVLLFLFFFFAKKRISSKKMKWKIISCENTYFQHLLMVHIIMVAKCNQVKVLILAWKNIFQENRPVMLASHFKIWWKLWCICNIHLVKHLLHENTIVWINYVISGLTRMALTRILPHSRQMFGKALNFLAIEH